MTLGLERTLVRLAIPSFPLFWMLDSYILLTQFSIWDKPFEMGVGGGQLLKVIGLRKQYHQNISSCKRKTKII